MSKTIIRTPNHLGDSLMAQPAIAAFAASRTDEDISLLIPEWAEPIFRVIPDVILLLVESKHLHGVKAIMHQSELLRRDQFDTGILLTPSFSSALIFYLAGVKHRYGYRTDNRGYLLNHWLQPEMVSYLHRSERYLHLLSHAARSGLRAGRAGLSISGSAESEAIRVLKENGLEPEESFVAVAPQAVAESRRWGNENHSALARRIIESLGFKVVLMGSKEESEAGETVASGEKSIVNLCGATDVETAAAILSMAKLFIGNDSGLAHLSAAVDTPLAILSGADLPEETSPLSKRKEIIIKDHLECISCVKNICPKSGEDFMRCMREISVDEVFEAVQRLL